MRLVLLILLWSGASQADVKNSTIVSETRKFIGAGKNFYPCPKTYLVSIRTLKEGEELGLNPLESTPGELRVPVNDSDKEMEIKPSCEKEKNGYCFSWFQDHKPESHETNSLIVTISKTFKKDELADEENRYTRDQGVLIDRDDKELVIFHNERSPKLPYMNLGTCHYAAK